MTTPEAGDQAGGVPRARPSCAYPPTVEDVLVLDATRPVGERATLHTVDVEDGSDVDAGSGSNARDEAGR